MSMVRASEAYVEAIDLSVDIASAIRNLGRARTLEEARRDVLPLLIAAAGKWAGVNMVIKMEPRATMPPLGDLPMLPPIRGGSPEADGWDSWTDEWRWELGPGDHQGETPLHVLEADAPEDDEDPAYAAWVEEEASARRWTEADQIAIHGCC